MASNSAILDVSIVIHIVKDNNFWHIQYVNAQQYSKKLCISFCMFNI